MPSFINHINHSRTSSWPPSFHLLDVQSLLQSSNPKSKDAVPALADIDEDPFAHFISPVTEDENPFDDFSFNAGIIAGEPTSPRSSKAKKFKKQVAKKWARYVQHNHEQLHRLYHGSQYPSDHIDNSLPVIFEPDQHRGPPTIEEELARPYRTEIREPTRGRAQDLLTPNTRKRKRSRSSSRTLSGHRHSWREPSVDLFTVMEEGEAAFAETDEGANRRSYSDSNLAEKAKM